VLLLVLGGALPTSASGQAPPQAAVDGDSDGDGSGGLALRCSADAGEGDPFLAEVARARDLESSEAALAALDGLEPEARRHAEASPNDALAQYRLAAVMGARLDHQSGTDKMSGAEALQEQAERVLTLEPVHPGASYMIGKLHASVRRLGGVKRFLAGALFGGGALKGASWEEARSLLEQAVRGDPCVPEHHFELARVYAHDENVQGWERELAAVFELTEGGDGAREARLRARAEGFQKEWREKGGGA
jgi:hypothetical protein